VPRLVFQHIDVGQILKAANCALVSNQGVFPHNRNRDPIELCRILAGKCVVATHTADAGKINSSRNTSELDELLGFYKIRCLNPDSANPNSFKIATSNRALSGVGPTKISRSQCSVASQGKPRCVHRDDVFNAPGV